MFDVVIQGPIYDRTVEIINSYLSMPFIGKVIYSGWEDDKVVTLPPSVTYIRNKKPDLAGGGNINYQIQTSKAGLEHVTSELVLKTRSDLIIDRVDLEKVYNYFLLETVSKSPIAGPIGKILTISISPNYAFFTWDFIYFGHTQDVKNLFSCQLDPNPNYFPNLTRAIIPETYITVKYIALHDKDVGIICNDMERFLVQGREGYMYSKSLSNQVLSRYFHPLPVFNVVWTKYYKTPVTTKEIMIKFGRHNDIFSVSW